MLCRLPNRISTVVKIDYADNFADNEWAKIIEVCQAGLVPTTWEVGDQKAMDIGGTSYMVDIIGIQHDDYADGSGKAPFTFQLHDCYGTTYKMNDSSTNAGGWASCKMRTTHLPAILALMPSEVQAGIKEVNKLTSAGSSSSTINTTADKLFLLSEIEIHGTVTHSASGEGSQYSYYSAGGSKIKHSSGWWQRSPRLISRDYFCCIYNDGKADNGGAGFPLGVSFGFCF